MTEDKIQPQGAQSASETHSEYWTHRIAQLRDEVAKLTRLLSDIALEEKDAQEQMRSLKYAADLTRGEAQRRARANRELSSAYGASAPPDGDDAQLSEVQRLEGELLNAKRDSANVIFEVDALEFRLKKLRERAGDARPGAGPHAPLSPASPVLRSPQLTSLAGRSSGSIKSSPLGRPGRLIGDVDVLAGFGEGGAAGAGRRAEYAACRLGIGTGGHMGLYSYGSAAPVLLLDDRSARTEPLSEGDARGLRDNVSSVDLQIGAAQYELCGLRESVTASTHLVQDASELLQPDDEGAGGGQG